MWESDKIVSDNYCDEFVTMMKNMKVKSDKYLLDKTTEAPVFINSFATYGYYSG